MSGFANFSSALTISLPDSELTSNAKRPRQSSPAGEFPSETNTVFASVGLIVPIIKGERTIVFSTVSGPQPQFKVMESFASPTEFVAVAVRV